MPTSSSGMSFAGTIAWSSISVRSTTVTSGASNATFSPGWTWRLATMPESGAVATASLQRVPREPHLRLGGLHAAARHIESCYSELSNAVCEMNFCFSSFWLVASVFSASASCARPTPAGPGAR